MNKWNVIFLIDQLSPTRVVLLKRGEDRAFAPGLYTGIGGKVEPGETVLASAYRELAEETGLQQIELTEFARCFVNDVGLFYFFGLYDKDTLPFSDEGTLEWVDCERLTTKHIISSTLEIVKEWQSRAFSTEQRWTLYLEGTERDEHGVLCVNTVKCVEGI